MGVIETLPSLLHTAITIATKDVFLEVDKNHFSLGGFIKKSLFHKYVSLLISTTTQSTNLPFSIDNNKKCREKPWLKNSVPKSSSADDTKGFEKFKKLFAEHITSSFIAVPEGLQLEDYFSLDSKRLFK